MAKRISFDDRLRHARSRLNEADQRANTTGLKNEVTGMKKMLRIFEGESDETIKAEKKHELKSSMARAHPPDRVPDGGGE